MSTSFDDSFLVSDLRSLGRPGAHASACLFFHIDSQKPGTRDACGPRPTQFCIPIFAVTSAG